MRKWPRWAFKFRTFVAGVFTSAYTVLDWAEMSDELVTDTLIDSKFPTTASTVYTLNQQLYTALVQVVEGEALEIEAGPAETRGRIGSRGSKSQR